MGSAFEKAMNCAEFESILSEYVERTLDKPARRAASAHLLKCPICHSLVNDVKRSISVCREMAGGQNALSRLEAKILASTVPDAALRCYEFEESLTDYLDGFLPANVFHRWERHAVICEQCTDLPGEVVRSLATLVAYKEEELPVPAGLHERIMNLTAWAEGRQWKEKDRSWAASFADWISSIRVPVAIPQLAPVAMMLMFAFLFISQTVSSDGSLSDVYAKSVQLAEKTYRQGTAAWNGQPAQNGGLDAPINGTTFVENEGGKQE